MSKIGETWDKTMREATNVCTRSEDLIAYLYNEATRAEATDFENHLRVCTGCKSEVEAFGVVRESIGEWRQQALGAPPSSSLAAQSTPAFRGAEGRRPDRRSALVAIREFFTLSPAWMRAATAALALVFVGLAIVAVAYFAQQPTVVVVDRPAVTDTGKSETARGITPESTPGESGKGSGSPNITAVEKPRTQGPTKRRTISPAQVAGRRKQILQDRSGESLTELAAANDYLPFTVPSVEDKLPSLVDLADDPN